MNYKTIKEALADGCIREDGLPAYYYGGETIEVKGVKLRKGAEKAKTRQRWIWWENKHPKIGVEPHAYIKVFGRKRAVYRRDQVGELIRLPKPDCGDGRVSGGPLNNHGAYGNGISPLIALVDKANTIRLNDPANPNLSTRNGRRLAKKLAKKQREKAMTNPAVVFNYL